MRNKKQLAGMLAAALAIALVFGMALAACNNPAGGGRPAELADNATKEQAIAKLDEMIAYPNTPARQKSGFRTLQADVYAMNDLQWNTSRSTYISIINEMIRSLP